MSQSDLQDQVDRLGAGETLKLEPPGREFQGPIVLRRPVTIEGQGATIWAPQGPVLSIQADGVGLSNLNVEITSNEGSLDGETACALLVTPGLAVTLNHVTVRGNVLGLREEEGSWRFPRSLPLGNLKAHQQNEYKVKLEVPVACTVKSHIDGLHVSPVQLPGGPAEVTFRVEPLGPGTRLRGEIWIQTPLLTRRITVSGNVPKSDAAGAVGGTGQVIFDPGAPSSGGPRPPRPMPMPSPAPDAPHSAPATAEAIPPSTLPVSPPSTPITSTPAATTPVKPVIIVSKLGTGNFHTLAEAIRSASSGSRILVQPGLYKESLVIDRRLEIIGDGPRPEITIESQGDSCLRIQADYAVVRGLTLRGLARRGDRDRPAVAIPHGQIILEDCDISSDAHACVSVHGNTADPVLRYCKIHGGRSAGVLLANSAEGRLVDCEIHGNGLAGIEIRQGATPTVQRCKIQDGKQVGVLVHDGGKGTLEDCDIAANALANIEIRQGGNPVVRRCKIRDSQYPGLLVTDNGLGIIEDCDISGNALAGVEVARGGQPTVRRCRIRDGRHAGLFFGKQAQGTVEDCDIAGHAQAGVEIRQGSNPVLRRCKIHEGKEVGVLVADKGEGALEDCEVFANLRAGVEVRQRARPLLSRCQLHDNQQAGVLFRDHGDGQLVGCEIGANGWTGVAILTESDPALKRCKIHDNKLSGITVAREGAGKVDDCEIFGHPLAGLAIAEEAHPVVRRCAITRNGDVGVWAFQKAAGQIENCDLTGNARAPTDIQGGCSVTLTDNKTT
jgi:F-box protein 11